MELHQITYFLAASETLNFTRAAESCDVAVPTLTRAIKKLEEELGGQLFRRERHLTHLTDLGRLLQIQFRTAHTATEQALAEARRYQRAEAQLTIGVISTMPSRPLVEFLRTLRSRAPDLELNIWESNCEEIASALDNGEIDIAIMSLPSYPEHMRPITLCREQYFVAFAPGHRFESMNAVPLRELEGEAYIKRQHCEFPSNFAASGEAKPYDAVRVRYTSEREDWIQSMVAADLGCTLMPEFLPILPGILLRPIVDPEVYRTISVVTIAGRQHSAPVKLALDAARAFVWSAVTDPAG
jgi:DNA-binding transcriptional LysR family regulator